MRTLIAKLLDIAFSEMKEKIKEQSDIIQRQNQIIVSMDEKIEKMESKLNKLEKTLSIEEEFDIDDYKNGVLGGE